MSEKKDATGTESSNCEQVVSEDAGKFLLRVTVAGLMLFHGVTKLTGGVGGIEAMLENANLPGALAYGAYFGEFIAPSLILLGIFTRMASLVLAFNMFVAILLGHANEVAMLNQHGGWAIELQMLYLLGAVSIALLGPGRFSILSRRGLLR